MNESTILNTVPAANTLNKIPGFDPMKHLRRAINKQNESVMQLELRYQRLWFRLAYPKGRMLLNPLRITDQLAIFEAKVFFQKEDSTPVSSFTSHKSVQETPDYIRAAQDEALKIALDNAGFGIQLCDVTQPPVNIEQDLSAPPIQIEHTGQEQPALVNDQTGQTLGPTSTAEEVQTVQHVESNIKPVVSAQGTETDSTAELVPELTSVPQSTAQNGSPKSLDAESAAAEGAPGQAAHQDTAPQAAEALADSEQSPLSAVLDFPAPSSAQTEDTTPQSTKSEPAAASPLSVQAEASAQATSSYSEDMTVEEICKVMTLDEARNVVVTKGTCNGWTMGQVAEKRFASLRFYLSGFGHCNNVQLAAATLLMQDVEQKKVS